MGRRPDERGAVALFTALMTVVVLAAAAIVVDVGVQRVARADMQALADVVALDLARELDGRTAAQIGALDAQAAASRDRNASSIGSTPTLTPSLWVLDPATGTAAAAGPDDVPNAVRVVAGTTVGFALGLADGGSATRSATAYAAPNACLRLGSSAVSLDELLGVSLSAATYHGLATGTLTLADLAARLSAGTVDQLLAAQVTLAEFALAVADALDDSGEGSAASLVRASVVGAASAGVGLGPVVVGDLLAVGPAGDAALAATVDALSLLTGAAYVANGDNALDVPVSSSIGDLTHLTADLHVIEPPRIACGGASAETAQLRLEVRGRVGVPPLTADLTASLRVAHASGTISSVSCTDGEAVGLTVDLAEPTLAELTAEVDSVFGTVPLEGTEPAQGAGGSYDLTLPENYDTPRQSSPGAGGLGLPDLDPGGLPAGLVIPVLVRVAVVATLNGVLDGLTSAVVEVADDLGLRLSSADMYGVRSATCLNPSLVD